MKTGRAVIAKGEQVIDDAAKVVENFGRVVSVDTGMGTSFMMSIFDEGKAALGAGGGAGKGAGGRMLSAAEARLVRAAKKLEKAKGWIGDVELHHVFPQSAEFRDMFRGAGINIHQFTFSLNKAAHRIIHDMHDKKVVKSLGLDWNEAWAKWQATLGEGVTPTKKMVEEQAEKMMEEFGLMHYWEQGGGEWVKYKGFWKNRIMGMFGMAVDNYKHEKKVMAALGLGQ